MMLIDLPTPFSPASEWEEFLAKMQALTPTQSEDAALVRSHIKLAKEMLGIRPRFRCPNCKQKTGVNIIYGLPDEELWEQSQRKEVALGGCMQTLDAPDRQCLSCDHQWQIVRRS